MLTVSINEEFEITPDLISEFIKKHREELPRLEMLNRYYKGEHDILSRVKDNRLANNRIVCNHAKYITDTAIGYLIGNPVRYTSKSGTQELGLLNNWFGKADSDTQDIDVAKNGAVFGRACEMLYMSDEEKPSPRLASLDPRSTFVVYDDSVECKPVFGVYYYPLYDGSERISGYCCYVCDDDIVKKYELSSDFVCKVFLSI